MNLAQLKDILHFYFHAGVVFPVDNNPLAYFQKKNDAKPSFPVSNQDTPSKPNFCEIVSPANNDLLADSQKKSNAKPSFPTSKGYIETATRDSILVDQDWIYAQINLVTTLDELKQLLENFTTCSLRLTANRTCFSDGTPGSPLMIIGEAPGREEDKTGIPFVGKAGQLLTQMLRAISLNRNDVYITNVVPWRPPGNRAPSSLEIELCRPFIQKQIELANPKVILALGVSSAQFLSSKKEGILRLRGKWFFYTNPNGCVIPVLPSLHPAYLLRVPTQKKHAWSDLLKIKQKLLECS